MSESSDNLVSISHSQRLKSGMFARSFQCLENLVKWGTHLTKSNGTTIQVHLGIVESNVVNAHDSLQSKCLVNI
jgi:hypothetical protein